MKKKVMLLFIAGLLTILLFCLWEMGNSVKDAFTCNYSDAVRYESMKQMACSNNE
ncbi:MAG: hypothetical protein HY958_04770 [Bacteroidia bacterium]|nr:hypothetical protein [Bacteroidia bacterium]